MNKDQLSHKLSNSIFNRNRYTVTIDIRRLARGLMFYIDGNKDGEIATSADVFADGIPAFQRDNDKWDLQRQINFVENVVSGYKPTIQLYTLSEEGCMARSYILDGLQRITALFSFINGDFNIFDGQVSFADLVEYKLSRQIINLEVFTFGSHAEAAQFYIDINRGITHSDADIERAVNFIAESKA